MWETLAAGLLLAGISGLTLLAYRHPPAFAKLYFPLLGLDFFGLSVVAAWDAGVNYAQARLAQFISPEKLSEADALIRSTAPRWWLVMVIFTGVNFYLLFLYLLPLLIGDKKEKRSD